MIRWLVLTAAVACAAAQQDTARKVDEVFQEYAQAGSPGCAVGVIRNGEMVMARGYGLANVAQAIPITPATMFDLGSTSKQFTAASIVLLAQRGKLSLDDDLRKFLPEIPDHGHRISIRHLLNHTSGLRDYLGLMSLAGVDFEGVTNDADALRIVSRQKALNFAPGDEHLYSNTGYFLLSLIVKRTSGKSLRRFAQENIFEPLGMKRTHFRDDHTEVVPLLATGYGPKRMGAFPTSMSKFEQTGDGAVFSNVEDLLLWDRNFYEPKIGGTDLNLQLLRRGVLNSGKELEYAAGLVHGNYRGLKTVAHGGAWAGYRAELLRFPEQRFSVACLCNLATTAPSQLAQKVADIFLAGAFLPEAKAQEKAAARNPVATAPFDLAAVRDKVATAPVDLAKHTGLYGNPSAASFRKILLKDGRPKIETYSFGEYDLVPDGPGRFELKGVPFKLAVAFRDSMLDILRDGAVVERLQRLDEARPTTERLAEYAGTYESEELETRYVVALAGDGLTVQAKRGRIRNLTSLNRDNFVAPGLYLAFRRDSGGNVNGFTIQAGRVRGIGFERIR